MRILSLHYPLPNAEIDNKDIFNAPSLFEYDVIIFHPLGFEQSIFNWLNEEEEFYTAYVESCEEHKIDEVTVSKIDSSMPKKSELMMLLKIKLYDLIKHM